MKDSYSLDELYSYLRQFHLSESLYAIGAVNSALKFGGDKLDTKNIPNYILAWIETSIKQGRIQLEILLHTSRMARFLLLSGASDYRNKALLPGSIEFEMAFHMTACLYDTDIEKKLTGKRDISKLIGRISSWQFPVQANRLTPLGRGYLLFVSIPERLQLEYNCSSKMKEFFGITTFEYLVSGYALWIMTNGTLDFEMKVEINELKSIITRENLQTLVSLTTGSPEEYRKLVRGDNWKTVQKNKDVYALDPFLTIPCISVTSSSKLASDSFVVPQPKYLLDKISTGMFYLLADKERHISELEKKADKKNSFRNSFGVVYREYVRLQLSQLKKPHQLIDLDIDYENKDGGKIPDFALIIGETCILIEVKTSILKINARTYYDDDTLQSEIKDGGIVKALKQLHSFRSMILSKKTDVRFDDVSNVISLLVCYEDIYVLNSSVLPLLKNYYSEYTDSLQLGCISDIEAIGNALSLNEDIAQILTNKLASPELKNNMIAATIEQKIGMDNQILRKAHRDFLKRMNIEF